MTNKRKPKNNRAFPTSNEMGEALSIGLACVCATITYSLLETALTVRERG